AGCRRGTATSPSSGTRWTSTSSSRRRSTSERRRGSSGWDTTAARNGTACSTRSRRSRASRYRSSEIVNTARWRRIRDLLERSMDLRPAERRTFLDDACGDDPDLLAEIEGLLAHDASAVEGRRIG